MDRPITIDRRITLGAVLSAIISLLTLLTVVAGMGVTYAKLMSSIEEAGKFQAKQEAQNQQLQLDRTASKAGFDTRLNGLVELINKQLNISDTLTNQVGQLQKKDEETDARIGRMTESYADQFTDMRGQLATISTQIALANQALTRLEAVYSQNVTPNSHRGGTP